MEAAINKEIIYTPESFGEITTLPKSKFGTPTVYPKQEEHPRLLFTKNSLKQISKNLSAAENSKASAEYMRLSDTVVNGILNLCEDRSTHNMNYTILAVIEAKAFRYALTGDVIYAKDALYAIKNYIVTLDIPEGSLPDCCRAFGYVMYIASCVYDWCYDVLTDEDRRQLVAGCQTLLAPNMEIGMPPVLQGSVTGHGPEAQVLRDWLSLAIAAYDEYPDIYEHVGGRVFHDYKPSTDFYLKSGSHWQGCAYGPYRQFFLMYSQHLMSRMTDGTCDLFCSGMHDAAITFLHYIRPDNQALRIGDDFNEYGSKYHLGVYHTLAFLTGTYYKDPYLKGYAKKTLNDFSTFYYSNCALTPVMFLSLNNPSLECRDIADLPTSVYNGSPLGSIIARSAWNNPNAAMVYMKVGEAYSANHEHKDAGSFQIYYKGILASNSGSYDSYFTPHDISYNKQTISTNSLLIFNPEMKDNGRWIYSGGQTIEGRVNDENKTLEGWLNSPTAHQAEILAHHCKPEARYFYLAGDITNAYDKQTADRVIRYMLSVMTDDEWYPMIFVTYDYIKAKDAAFKKTYLLHVQQEPQMTDDGMIIVRNEKNGNSGKLIAQSCVTETEVTAIGGEGQRFLVNGKDYPLKRTYSDLSINEAGWGRVEITPSKDAELSRLLTLMYVTDAANAEAPIIAQPIETATHIGAELLGCVTVFGKEPALFSDVIRFEVNGNQQNNYFVAGIKQGAWRVSINGAEIGIFNATEEDNMLAFTAGSGAVTITPLHENYK